MGNEKKLTSNNVSNFRSASSCFWACKPPMTSLAAAPAEIPSQISMSIGGGAEEGKTAMSFNWVTDLSVDASEIVYSTSPNLENASNKKCKQVYTKGRRYYYK